MREQEWKEWKREKNRMTEVGQYQVGMVGEQLGGWMDGWMNFYFSFD